MTVRLRGQTLASVTASFGVAMLHEHGKTGPDVMKAADDALYEAKKAGRDRVAIAYRFTEQGLQVAANAS